MAIDPPEWVSLGPGLDLTVGQACQWRLDVGEESLASRSFLVRAEGVQDDTAREPTACRGPHGGWSVA